ncbi:Thymic stromal lymphopoietin [Camelus dromedarius]|uniref:Thymic stromal lymphopoietin n=1 Tax=Camelus dromedarius TaxID=9838 RepID=A0A5N4ED45_CAMDR|nr:Thymic stromal lymphopoietin [Camelus dromedarius]
MVFFRKIFILQLVGLALTYNFTDCDFEKIKETYQNVIYEVLKEYIKGTKSIRFNRFVYCEDRAAGFPGDADPVGTTGLPENSALVPSLGLLFQLRPDCLTKIERFTFERNHGCTSLASEIFAEQTNATFALHCTGYPGIEISITQAMKTRREREVKTNKCLEQVSKLIELWRRFCRIKQSKTSLKSHFTATE